MISLTPVGIEVKKMIVNSIIKRIDVCRSYELNIELNRNIRRFFLGLDDNVIPFPKTA